MNWFRKTRPAETGAIHRMDGSGDTKVATWDKADEISVEHARKVFDELVRGQYLTYDVSDVENPVVTRTFRPEAAKIIARPQIVGG